MKFSLLNFIIKNQTKQINENGEVYKNLSQNSVNLTS